MPKYHVNSKSEIKVCHAVKSPCPFGEISEHFDDIREAQIFCDKVIALEKEYEDIIKAEPDITLDVYESLQKENYLVDENHKLKTFDSIRRKILMGNRFKSCYELNDVIRYTMISKDENIEEDVQKVLQNFISKEHKVVFVKVKWEDDGGYKGINVKMQNKDGHKWEFQIHTEESFEAKRKAHVFYEKSRNPAVSNSEKEEAIRMQEEAFNSVPPKDFLNLKKFLKENAINS